MHPYEEAIEFLLSHVARTGDNPAQAKALHLLEKIVAYRKDEIQVRINANRASPSSPADAQKDALETLAKPAPAKV